MVEPLGWGAVVFLLGWFAITGLLVVNRSPVRLGTRLAGWALLTTAAAVAADWFGAGLAQLSAAGRGGSIGAYIRFGLEDAFQPLPARLILAAAALVGLVLAADWLVVGLVRAAGRLFRALWRAAVWGNDRVADGSEKVITGLGAAAKVVGQGANTLAKVAKTAIPSVPARKPVSVSAETPAPAPGVLPFATEPANHDDIPIHVHTEHMPTPVTLFRPDAAEETPAERGLRTPAAVAAERPRPVPGRGPRAEAARGGGAPRKDLPRLRPHHQGGRHPHRPGHHAVRGRARNRPAAEQGHQPRRRPRAEPAACRACASSRPLPGRNTVGIEVPNEIRQTVRLKELVTALATTPKVAKFKLPIFLGKDVEGRPLAYDLADDAAPAHRRPHRHRQVGVPEHHHRQPASHAPAGRVPDDPDRPEEGRTLATTPRSRT